MLSHRPPYRAPQNTLTVKKTFIHSITCAGGLALIAAGTAQAQLSSYTFSAEVGTWIPLAGSGTPLGMPGLGWPFTFDDNSFVTQGESLPLGSATTGNGWPIGFTFHFNGQAYDRVGLSMEGWLALGRSADGVNAVYVPVGDAAYTPLSSTLPAGMDPSRRSRIAGFAMDLAAQGNGGLWPIQIATRGTAPNRFFIAEWNVVRSTGGGTPISFQIKLNEGGGNPAQQTVQVIYGSMAQATTNFTGQVGLAGGDPSDFNNRTVTNIPYDWLQSQPGSTNTATCRVPSSSTNLPQGLTFTWTPAGCSVSGIAITGLGMQGGMLSGTLGWNALPGATSYDYRITAGGPDAPALLSGTGITGTSVELHDLPIGQLLHAYVKADCAEADAWGAGQPFSTEGYMQVECGTPPSSFVHCYGNLEDRSWHYTSSTGDPLRLLITGGNIGNGDLLRVYDGPNAQAPLLYSSTSGTAAGQVITSTGASLTMRLVTDDVGSCQTQDFILPLEWEVGCYDCEPILANFQVQNDCAASQFSVQVAIFSMGSAGSATISSTGAAASVPVAGSGTYTIGPFPVGSPVTVTVEHDHNAYCSAVSELLVNDPCPTISCGPDAYTYCYDNNETSQWAFQSANGERIGIRFISGTLASGDAITIYDGLDPFDSAPLFNGNNGGNLANLMVATSASNMDDALLLELVSNGSSSCTSGSAQPWHYVVACYDGCTPPSATFTTVRNCDESTFTVQVGLTQLGSAPSVQLVDDAGSAPITASATGSYQLGPFALSQTVTVEVRGSSDLCTVTSPALTEECETGIKENMINGMRVFPNPGDGAFRLVMPEGFGGQGRLEVLDVAGRSVAGLMLRDTSGRGVDCHLEQLPAGRYTLILHNDKNRAYAPISVIK